MAYFCPKSTQTYDCSRCDVSHNKTVKLWRHSCMWGDNVKLMCRKCAEDYSGQKLTDSSGPMIGNYVLLPAIPYDKPLPDDFGLFRPYSIYSPPIEGYSHWADLPEK